MIAQMIPRVIKMLTKPREYWDEMVAETGDAKTLLPTILVMSAIPAAMFLIGIGLLGGLRLPGAFFVRFFVATLFATIILYATNVGMWFLLANFIDWFAATFGAQRDPEQSRKLATAIIPAYLGGVFAITTVSGLMWLGVLGGAGYGAYLLYLGLPLMNGTPAEKAGGYAAAVMGCTMGAMMVMGALMCVPMSCCMASAFVG